MRPFQKLRGKLPTFSKITNVFLKYKNRSPTRRGWEILPGESAQYLLRPKPELKENGLSLQRNDISWRISDAGNTKIAGTLLGSTDLLAIFLDPLDPDGPEPLTETPYSLRENDNCSDKTDVDLSFIVPHQERVPSDGALSVAHPSPNSLISDGPTLINPSDTPFKRTPRPEIHDIDIGPPEPLQESKDSIKSAELLKISSNSSSLSFINLDFTNSAKVLQDFQLRLVFPSSVRDISTWTEEVLAEYRVNPDCDSSFRQFVHRQRVVEWRRYRVHHRFVTAKYRGEYLVVKVQDDTSSGTRFLYLDRLIQPKDAHFWKRHDNLEDWLECVETEGCFDLEIDRRVTITWGQKRPPESRDSRLIFGLWTPCDRIMVLEDWPRNDVKREGHVFEPKDRPDLLDLFIAARAVHLDANFSMFRRQDHWFAKLLSRVLNQRWDKYDVLSVTDEDKFDKRYRLPGGKWDRIPVSKIRHKEVLKLRDHCDGRRKLIFMRPQVKDEKALGAQDMSLARERVNNKGVEIRNLTDKTERRTRKLRKFKRA